MAYTFTGRKSGSVRFEPDSGTITRESLRFTSQVTSNPIESGSDIHDHVINEPKRLTVNGSIVGGDADKDALERMRDRRDIVTYIGRVRATNLVFTSLQFNTDPSNKDGFIFSAQLQRIDMASPETMDVGTVPLMTRQDTGRSAPAVARQSALTGNTGTQTTVTQIVSNSAYAAHVRSFAGSGSQGTVSGRNPSFNGVR